MKLMLKELFEVVSSQREIDGFVTSDELVLPEGYSLKEPVAVKGRVFNRAGIVTIEYKLKAFMMLVCDRCLDEFEDVFEYDFSHILVTQLNNSDEDEEYILCGDNVLDLDELAISDLLLQLPSKILCKEDCKGLCFVCGQNLNEATCECSKSQ